MILVENFGDHHHTCCPYLKEEEEDGDVRRRVYVKYPWLMEQSWQGSHPPKTNLREVEKLVGKVNAN